VHDPARGKRVLTLEEASRHFTGVAMEFTPSASFQRKDEREGMRSWQLLGVASGLEGDDRADRAALAGARGVRDHDAVLPPAHVDRVLVGRDRDLLTVLGMAFAVLIVIQVAVTAVRAWVGVYLSTNINLRLLTNLFNHMLRLPLRVVREEEHRRHRVEVQERRRDPEDPHDDFRGDRGRRVMVVLTLIVMLYYSVTLTMVVLFAALLYAMLRWMFFYPQRYATDEQIAHEARSSTHFIETCAG
jgi:ATP-binding cassette subfamily B protein RaxB